MEPINYASVVESPFDAVAQGYKLGAGILDGRQKQQAMQVAQQQQQQLMAARQAVMNNPTAENYSNLMLLDPKAVESTQKAWATRNDAQQESFSSDLGSWGSALINKQPQLVSDALTRQADAIEQQAGGKTLESQSKRDLATLVQQHPDVALGKIMALASANPKGQQVAAALKAQMSQNSDLRKADAEATSAEAKASVDVAGAPALAQKPALDNQKTQQDIAASQLSGRISELNTQISQANSETERGKLILERDKLTQQQKEQAQAQGQAAQDTMDSAQSALDTVATIKTAPGLSGFFTGPGTVLGQLWKHVPGSDRKAVEVYVDQLKSQLSMSNLMAAKAASPTGSSGFGALSDGDIRLMANTVANLDTSSDKFPDQLATVEKVLHKTVGKSVANKNLPTAGGAFVMSSPVYGDVTEGTINRLLKQHPGSTRSQILDFLGRPQTPTIPSDSYSPTR